MLLEFDYDASRWGFWLRENFRTSEYMELIYTEDYKLVGMSNYCTLMYTYVHLCTLFNINTSGYD